MSENAQRVSNMRPRVGFSLSGGPLGTPGVTGELFNGQSAEGGNPENSLKAYPQNSLSLFIFKWLIFSNTAFNLRKLRSTLQVALLHIGVIDPFRQTTVRLDLWLFHSLSKKRTGTDISVHLLPF